MRSHHGLRKISTKRVRVNTLYTLAFAIYEKYYIWATLYMKPISVLNFEFSIACCTSRGFFRLYSPLCGCCRYQEYTCERPPVWPKVDHTLSRFELCKSIPSNWADSRKMHYLGLVLVASANMKIQRGPRRRF